jgi:hypothetical protein
MKDAYTIKQASELLGVSRKTLYSRLKNPKFKNCFIIDKTKKTGFLFYKKECIDKELNNRLSERDLFKFTEYYYSIVEKIANKKNVDFDKGEKYLKKYLRKYLNYGDLEKLVNVSFKTKKKFEIYKNILNLVEKEIENEK